MLTNKDKSVIIEYVGENNETNFIGNGTENLGVIGLTGC